MYIDIKKIKKIPTPFYYYDINLLRNTLEVIRAEANKYNYKVHYALKANANTKILKLIKDYGFGADCVSGNEIKKAIKVGFPTKDIVYAGVGKTDKEISEAINSNIFCFNCESMEELIVINNIAEAINKKTNVALRLNPNIDANTYEYTTTGLAGNKFGIDIKDIKLVINELKKLKNIQLIGLHFHIGSQITDLNVFKNLCLQINNTQNYLDKLNVKVEHINVGGGLGINYNDPDKDLIPDFRAYFSVFNKNLNLRTNQQLHFELGRSVVAQCGILFTKVLYLKKSSNTTFLIVDAGMTELLRPALYKAYHKIENISSNGMKKKYDIVGPICESSDFFAKAAYVSETKRNDILAIRSVGAYGQVMSSQYNLRNKAKAYYSKSIF